MKTVTIYALSTCPWCMKAKRFFSRIEIPFESVDYDLADIDTQRRIMAEMDEHGISGFPVVKIDNEVISGYNPERFAKALSK